MPIGRKAESAGIGVPAAYAANGISQWEGARMARRSEDRDVRRRANRLIIIRRIANTLLFKFGIPLLVIVVIGIGIAFFDFFDAATKPTVWSFTAAAVGIITLLIAGQIFISRTTTLQRAVSRKLDVWADTVKEEIRDQIKTSVDPQVAVLRSKSEVRSAAADLFEGAIRGAIQTKKLGVVYYFGAASLKPSEQEFRDAVQSFEDHEHSDIIRYQNVLDELKNNSEVQIIRFIRLLDKNLFTLRDQRTRVAYLNWLQGEVTYLKVNQNYKLYDARRAPEWGGPLSSIATNNGILDIIGDGRAGRLLVSARIPAVFIHESKQHFWAARADDNKPRQYTWERANDLQATLDTLRALHQELLIREDVKKVMQGEKLTIGESYDDEPVS
jgi:hypothetical protein